MDKQIFDKIHWGKAVLSILSTAVSVLLALIHPMFAGIVLFVAFVGRCSGAVKVLRDKRYFLPEAVKIVVWMVLAGGIFWHYQQKFSDARSEADRVAAQVIAYHTAHGKYPSHDVVMQLPDTPLKGRMHYIPPENGRPPILHYKDPVTMFDDYIYDFQTRVWEHRPS